MNRLLVLLTALAVCALAVEKMKIPMKMPHPAKFTKSVHTGGKSGVVITPLVGPYIVMPIGTPPQDAEFSLDTQSGDTIVIDINADQPQPSEKMYAPLNSTTSNLSNYPYTSDVVDYNGYSVHLDGVIADDVFEPFGATPLAMRFGLIEKVTFADSSLVVQYPDIFTTGTVGLGFYASQNMDLFVPTLTKDFPSQKKQFSLVLHECMLDPTNEESIGEFEVGGFDANFCNATSTVTAPIIGSSWDFQIQSFTVGNFTENYRQTVAVNTREMLTGVPASVYNYIAKMTNATKNSNSKWPEVDCSVTYPHLHFNVGGQNVSVHQDLYIFRDFPDVHTPCHLMLYPLNGGGFLPSWSFGYLWVYRKCMLFDYGSHAITFMDYNNGLCDNQPYV